MIRFAYPNVKPRESAFLGCGRYLTAPPESSPGDGYEVVRLNIPNRSEVHLAAEKLAPESMDSRKVVFETRDKTNERYRGESQDLAYVLTLISGARKLRIEETDGSGDIWCTGVVDIKQDDRPFLKAVDGRGFELKLKGFLSDANDDRVFIVPSANVEPHHLDLFGGGDAEILTLEQFRLKRIQVPESPKSVVKVRESELPLLVDRLFRRPSGNRRLLWGLFAAAAILLLVGGVWAYLASLPSLSDRLVGHLTHGRYGEAIRLASDSPADNDPAERVRSAMNRQLPLEVHFQFQHADQPPSATHPIDSSALDGLQLSHLDNYRLRMLCPKDMGDLYVYVYQEDPRGVIDRLFPKPEWRTGDNPVQFSRFPIKMPPEPDSWIYLDEIARMASAPPLTETLHVIAAPWRASDLERIYAEIYGTTDPEARKRLLARFSRRIRAKADARLPGVFYQSLSFRHDPAGDSSPPSP